jgi:hypothetical protein
MWGNEWCSGELVGECRGNEGWSIRIISIPVLDVRDMSLIFPVPGIHLFSFCTKTGVKEEV